MMWQRRLRLAARIGSLAVLCLAILFAPFVYPGVIIPGVGYAPIWAPPVSEYPGNPEYAIDFFTNLYGFQILLATMGVGVVFLSTYPESFFRKRDFGRVYRVPRAGFTAAKEQEQERL